MVWFFRFYQKMDSKGLLDLTFPIPTDRDRWTKPQQWYYTHYKGADTSEYLPYEDWVINGEAILHLSDGKIERYKSAQLRFGQNQSMRGFRLCLMARFHNIKDDKHEFETAMAAYDSMALIGLVRGMACFFRVYPFQHARLMRFLDSNPNVSGLTCLIVEHMRLCKKLLEKY